MRGKEGNIVKRRITTLNKRSKTQSHEIRTLEWPPAGCCVSTPSPCRWNWHGGDWADGGCNFGRHWCDLGGAKQIDVYLSAVSFLDEWVCVSRQSDGSSIRVPNCLHAIDSAQWTTVTSFDGQHDGHSEPVQSWNQIKGQTKLERQLDEMEETPFSRRVGRAKVA